ncbi:glycosyltransferase family 2 protein [Clostridium saudiense]|uniref:glycosyltransferase family 2 protein n=1 Tax=Clostridium saudiense TaxID=1414720 RepID=UPI00319EB21A
MKDVVSVIIPIYKVEEYIYDCIESVIKQSYRNLEIILVNDGSPDKCGEICNDYSKKDNRIKVIHKENGGLSSARNVGLYNSSGKYIVFIDSDDFVKEDYIELLLKSLIESNSDISMCSFEYVEKFNVKVNENILNENKIYSNFDIIKKTLEGKVQFYAWNKMYKRELFINNLISYPEGRLYEDMPTFMKLLLNSKKVSYINKVLYSYRIRENSITFEKGKNLANNFNDSIRDVNYILQSYNLINRFSDELINFNTMYTLMNCKNICIYSGYNSKKFYKEYNKLFKDNIIKYSLINILKSKSTQRWVKRDYILFKCKLLCIKNKIRDKREGVIT